MEYLQLGLGLRSGLGLESDCSSGIGIVLHECEVLHNDGDEKVEEDVGRDGDEGHEINVCYDFIHTTITLTVRI